MTDAERALYRLDASKRLRTDYARRTWNNTGYFNVPGVIMRELVAEGFAEMRKRGPSAPAEYKSRV